MIAFLSAGTSWNRHFIRIRLCSTLQLLLLTFSHLLCFSQKWKPYIIIGWALCAAMLVVLASMGEDVSPTNLVVMLTFANLGYVAADVAADGFMVWMAHHEPEKRRGKIQSLIYIMRSIGRILINVVIIFAFSGPSVNCPGYEEDPNVPCTEDESIKSRNPLSEEYPDTWCYQICPKSDFNFGLTIPQFAWIIAAANLASMPTYFMLFEEKKTREKVKEVLGNFWIVMKRRAVWQVMLYSMVSPFLVFASFSDRVSAYRVLLLPPTITDLVHYLQHFYCSQVERKLCLARVEHCSEPNLEYYGVSHLYGRSYSSPPIWTQFLLAKNDLDRFRK